MSDQKFTALTRMTSYLTEKKVDDETIAFLMGRMIRLITEQVGQIVAETLGKEALDKIEALKDEEAQAAELAKQYAEKTGQTIDVLREKLAEDLVKDFEAAT